MVLHVVQKHVKEKSLVANMSNITWKKAQFRRFLTINYQKVFLNPVSEGKKKFYM